MHPLSKDEVDRILDNNLVDEFDRLAGTPGFVLIPMPFQKVQDLARVGTLESLGQLGRHPEHIRTYRTFRSKVLQEWTSIQDYIQWKVFEWPISIAQEGRKSITVPHKLPDPPQVVWRPNDFPYYVQDGISHDNIWSTTPLTTEQLIQVMDDKLGPQRRYAYFINPGPLASIPGVWHAHCMHMAVQD
ncbi:hypothetical protein WJX82_000719 [Trebouxia sp. C0006]